MHRRTVIAQGRWQKTAGVMFSIALSAVTTSLFAQAAAKPERLTLGQAFDAAWSQQPEVASLAMRRDAAQAHQRAAEAWTPEPPALEVTGKTDRLGSSLGTREYEIGLTVPLWLPRERGSSQALAEAESRAVESRTTAAQLRVAAAVREAWWNWQRAAVELATAQDQLDSARRIALDVGKRLKAGDLARADQHQADGAVAAAQATVAGAEAASSVARQALAALMATPATHAKLTLAEPYAEPTPDPSPIDLSAHGDFQWLRDRAAVAQGVVALTATQSRASPELKIATTRGRGAAGEAWQQTVTVGVRIPFGAGPRYDARLAAARAESVELEALMTLERARLSGERDTAKARVEAARLQLVAADRRAQLARESRGFFDKSFRLGESDLPTRLRIEAEATEADRQAARARIELAAAISAWRQALGLLPQ